MVSLAKYTAIDPTVMAAIFALLLLVLEAVLPGGGVVAYLETAFVTLVGGAISGAITAREDPPLDVGLRNIGRLDTTVCERHQDRGVLIGPEFHNCMYCWRSHLLMWEMAVAAFYGVTDGLEGDSATEEVVVTFPVDLRESPSDTPHEVFREYVVQANRDPLGPLVHDDDGELAGAYAEG